MLKTSPFSPTQPRRAETRLFPYFVLGSSKSSTYRLRLSEVGSPGGVFPFAKIYCAGERPTQSAVGTSSGFDSPAALLDSRFEHPALWKASVFLLVTVLSQSGL